MGDVAVTASQSLSYHKHEFGHIGRSLPRRRAPILYTTLTSHNGPYIEQCTDLDGANIRFDLVLASPNWTASAGSLAAQPKEKENREGR